MAERSLPIQGNFAQIAAAVTIQRWWRAIEDEAEFDRLKHAMMVAVRIPTHKSGMGFGE
jgi:hypothetical protein